MERTNDTRAQIGGRYISGKLTSRTGPRSSRLRFQAWYLRSCFGLSWSTGTSPATLSTSFQPPVLYLLFRKDGQTAVYCNHKASYHTSWCSRTSVVRQVYSAYTDFYSYRIMKKKIEPINFKPCDTRCLLRDKRRVRTAR